MAEVDADPAITTELDGLQLEGSNLEEQTEEEVEYDEDGEPIQKEVVKPETPVPPTPVKELSPEALALKKEMDRIFVVAPELNEWQSLSYDQTEYPDSYKHNSPTETLILAYAENFRRQYVHLYRDRKPLLLNPVNECGIEKLVCTTIRPTQLPFIALYDWDGCASFVADYLNFEPLNPPVDLPKRLRSPMTVLKQQRGNCFEYATVLCSLLIAQGYDAYVVSGYATREVCLMDETREVCPLLIKKKEAVKQEVKRELGKYAVRPPKDLRSKYELKMAKRAEDKRLQEIEQKQQEEEQKIAELEKPNWDPLHGLRVHAWVLILEGKREISESFYIEPFTGLAYSLKTTDFHGIESLWNHQNFWVNMQTCANGVVDLKFDLGDCSLWEYMFASSDKPLLSLPDPEEDLDIDDEDEEDEGEKHLDLPPSWCLPISITHQEFESRCPQGKKTKFYKKAKLEKFAPYLLKDGLISRLSAYDDYELKEINQVKEYYENRVDHLYLRTQDLRTGWVSEYFDEGRSHALKEHVYLASSPGAESERTMLFYHEARVDGLSKREETPLSMTEHFVSREDFLYYQHIDFGPKPKKAGPKGEDVNPRPILKMVLLYGRDVSKEANVDIKELVFWMVEEKIQITYHTGEPKIAASTREYVKPQGLEEKGAPIIMTADMHTTFQVDPAKPLLKNLNLYQLLCKLLRDEDSCVTKVRESESEVRDILKQRLDEETHHELEISAYDTDRNERAKKHRRELEKQLLEEKMRREEMDVDFLAPFLAQMGDPEKLTREQALSLKEQCLADLKHRLIDKANLIQARFEKETADLNKKQQWYQQNKVSMQKDDEEEYVAYCTEAMFKIHILELRLQRHKERAPFTYMELDKKLRNDKRLTEFLAV